MISKKAVRFWLRTVIVIGEAAANIVRHFTVTADLPYQVTS